MRHKLFNTRKRLTSVRSEKKTEICFDREDEQLVKDVVEILKEKGREDALDCAIKFALFKKIEKTIYGYKETLEFAEKHGIEFSSQNPESIFVLLEKAHELEDTPIEVIVHLLGLIHNVNLIEKTSKEEIIRDIYIDNMISYNVGLGFAKATDARKNTSRISRRSLIRVLKRKKEGKAAKNYKKMCGMDVSNHDNAPFGYAGRIAMLLKLNIEENDTEEDILFKIVKSEKYAAEPGLKCAVAVDFGMDPYAGYDSIEEMVEKNNIAEKFNEAMFEIYKGNIGLFDGSLGNFLKLEREIRYSVDCKDRKINRF